MAEQYNQAFSLANSYFQVQRHVTLYNAQVQCATVIICIAFVWVAETGILRSLYLQITHIAKGQCTCCRVIVV